LSRRRPDAIFFAVRSISLGNKVLAQALVLAVCVTMVVAPLPRASNDPVPVAANTHFLRDGVPAAGFAYAPEDTTEEDPFLPEEKDTSQLVWEIAAWVVGAALVAFFIIKVFIEEDPDEPEEEGGTKPDPF
jgi:hypothetical protein